jgi:hypothetical protein
MGAKTLKHAYCLRCWSHGNYSIERGLDKRISGNDGPFYSHPALSGVSVWGISSADRGWMAGLKIGGSQCFGITRCSAV